MNNKVSVSSSTLFYFTKVDRRDKYREAHQNNHPHVPATDKREARKREAHVGKQDAGKRVKHVVNQDTARYRLYSITRKSVVAEGWIIMDDPDFTIGGQKLGTQYVEVLIDKAIVPDEPLIRPYGTYEVMHQVDGTYIAWPISLLKKII